MRENIDRGRRRFLSRAALAMATAGLGGASTGAAGARHPRQLQALGRGVTWFNAPAMSAASLSGRVVLVQFGTYTCINWLRTLPFVRAWKSTYGADLTLIVVHTPEFAFEANLENVRSAIEELHVDMPVVVDNDQAIWRAFDNHYWPAMYLFDARGRLRERQFGEGRHEQFGQAIRKALIESGRAVTGSEGAPYAATGFEVQADWRSLKSPEMYLGADRASHFVSGGAPPRKRRSHSAPRRLAVNEWALDGEWTATGASIAASETPGRIVCRFHARDVHLVMGPLRPHEPVPCRVSLDGQSPGSSHGVDVDDAGRGVVAGQRLYHLVRQTGAISERTLVLDFERAGAEAFAFTFG